MCFSVGKSGFVIFLKQVDNAYFPNMLYASHFSKNYLYFILHLNEQVKSSNFENFAAQPKENH